MANVQQAAKWLLAGHDVRRNAYATRWWLSPYEPAHLAYQACCADGGTHELDCYDLIADDWELCHSAATE